MNIVPDLEQFQNTDPEAFRILLLVLCVISVIATVFALIMYIFESIGLYSVAKRRGLKHPFMAWIPYTNTYLFGKAAEQYETAVKGKSKNYKAILLCLSIILTAVTALFNVVIYALSNSIVYLAQDCAYNSDAIVLIISLILLYIAMLVVSVIYSVFYFIALHKIYRSFSTKSSTLLLIFSIIFPVIVPFVIFASRKKDDGFIELNEMRKSSSPIE